jgi:hypothetical protein
LNLPNEFWFSLNGETSFFKGFHDFFKGGIFVVESDGVSLRREIGFLACNPGFLQDRPYPFVGASLPAARYLHLDCDFSGVRHRTGQEHR